MGIDIDPKLVELSRTRAVEEGVSHLVEFRAGDALEADISKATVVTLYMFHWFNNLMRPKLQQPGARIVAHDYDIEGWPTTITHFLRLLRKLSGLLTLLAGKLHPFVNLLVSESIILPFC